MDKTVGVRLAFSAVLALAALGGCGGSSFRAAPNDGDGDGGVDATAPLGDAAVDGPTPLADGGAGDAARGEDAGACGNLPAPTPVAVTGPALVVAGDPGSSAGIFDPSLVYPLGAPGGVLAYSSIAPDSVSTHLAVTLDLGATFTYIATANTVAPITVDTTDLAACGAAKCTGVLWHEVPSVVVDPLDPDAARRFKLFTHSYVSLKGGQELHREWGYIGMQTAPKPEGPWSDETKAIGWPSSSPLSSVGAAQLLGDVAPGCVLATEPGAMVVADGLYLALGCLEVVQGATRIRVELLRSRDAARSFERVSTLVDATDGPCLDGTTARVQGPDLFTVGGKAFVIVTPVGPVSPTLGDDGYRGCVTIPIADLARGKIARTGNGAPAVARFIHAPDGRFTGPCTYAEGATALGYLVPELTGSATTPFGVTRTTITAP